jgi:uncharacterized Zn-finger protein
MVALGWKRTTRYLAVLATLATPEFGNIVMTQNAPETRYVDSRQIACDGDEGALGHPRVYLKMDQRDYVECGYCDRRYILAGGAADARAKAA